MATHVPTGTQPPEMQSREKQAVPQEHTRPGLVFRPDVDIAERPNEYLLFADLPGVDERHVNVRLDDGMLSIDATLSAEPSSDWTPLYTEYQVGGYHREFRLSEQIDASKITARMRDGVLELHLPKTERGRPRTIEVRTDG